MGLALQFLHGNIAHLDDQELISAHPGDEVTGAVLLQGPGREDQGLVPLLTAVDVVDGLEMVQIQIEHADGLPLALLMQVLVQDPAVVQPGHEIGVGVVGDLALHLAHPGHVPGDTDLAHHGAKAPVDPDVAALHGLEPDHIGHAVHGGVQIQYHRTQVPFQPDALRRSRQCIPPRRCRDEAVFNRPRRKCISADTRRKSCPRR